MWQVLEEVTDYPDGEPWDGDPEGLVYGWEGQQWPRLCLSVVGEPLAVCRDPVVGDEPYVGLKVCVSAQKDPEHWWVQDYPLPPELVGDLIKLLEKHRPG